MTPPAPLRGTITAFPLLSKASALAKAGRLEDAAQQVMAHLRQYPEEPQGLAKLGEVAMLLGALGQAEHFLRRAIAKGGGGRDVRRHLASVLHQQDRLDEADELFAALQQEKDEPALRAMRAHILDKLGRNKEARKIFEKLTQTDSSNPSYWVALGHSHRAEGAVEAAIAAYRRAVEIDYEFGDGWWSLASIKSRVLVDEDIVHMRQGLEVAIDVRNSAPLHFALARAQHDRGNYADAFRHYSEGNRQRAEELGYDASELTSEVAEVERLVDTAFIAKLEQAPVGDVVPIFVTSLPRSGSTLLEQMLAAHPEIESIGELPYAPSILRGVMEMATRRGKVSVPQLVASLTSQQAAAIGQDYLRRANWHRTTSRRYFVDKLPHNWNNVLFLRRILPQAKFLDIRRPAMDCCFSNFTHNFSRVHASSFALGDIGQCYVDYVRLMTHFDRVAPGMVHHIRYDELIENPEASLRATLAHIELPWNPAVLEFHKLDRVVRTPSSEQVRRPLNRDGVGTWKPYAEWLGPLRDALGPLAQ